MHYTKDIAENFDYRKLEVADSFEQGVISQSSTHPEVDKRIWVVEYVHPGVTNGFPVIVVSTVEDGQQVFVVVGEGDWLGCAAIGNSVLDALSLELSRTCLFVDELIEGR